MKAEHSTSVQMWLKKIGGETTRRRYFRLLSSFCEWMKKLPDELIGEAKRKLVDKGEGVVQAQVENEINRFLEYLKGRRISKYTQLEHECAIRSFYQANGLPIETADVERRLNRLIRRTEREKKDIENVRLEALRKFADKMGESAEDLEKASAVHYKPYVKHGQKRLIEEVKENFQDILEVYKDLSKRDREGLLKVISDYLKVPKETVLRAVNLIVAKSRQSKK